MTSGWQQVSIGEATDPIERFEAPIPGLSYRQIGVRLWGEGAYEREPVDGGSTKYRALNRVETGDIIVNKIWARNGSVSVVLDGLGGCYCSGEFPLFSPRPDRLDPAWFYWITKTRWFWRSCDEQSRGTSGQNRIRPEKFAQIKIPLPPLAEQRRIVAKIERLAAKVDEAWSDHRHAAAGLEAYWPSILNRVLLGQHWIAASHGLENAVQLLQRQAAKYQGRPVSRYNNSSVDNPISIEKPGPLPEQWTWTTLGSVATHIVDCINDTPDFVGENTGYLGLKSTNIRPYRFDVTDCWYVAKTDFDYWNRREEPRPGDILLTREAPMGYACILPQGHDVCLTQRLMLLRSDPEFVAIEYLLHYLNSPVFREQVSQNCRGMTVPHIRVQDAPQFLVPLPPLAMQRRIIAYLDSQQAKIDRLKALQAQTRSELDALLSSILDRAFRGEL